MASRFAPESSGNFRSTRRKGRGSCDEEVVSELTGGSVDGVVDVGDSMSSSGARLLRPRMDVIASDRSGRGSAAFTNFYSAALTPVYSYLANRCASRAVAEDLVHDCFEAALSALAAGTDVSLPWIMRVARNKLVDHYRRDDVRRRHVAALESPVPDEVVAWQAEPSRDRALDALAQLSGDHRAVLVLRHMDGLPVPEVANLMNRSVHATESLLMRARTEFKAAVHGGERCLMTPWPT